MYIHVSVYPMGIDVTYSLSTTDTDYVLHMHTVLWVHSSSLHSKSVCTTCTYMYVPLAQYINVDTVVKCIHHWTIMCTIMRTQ